MTNIKGEAHSHCLRLSVKWQVWINLLSIKAFSATERARQAAAETALRQPSMSDNNQDFDIDAFFSSDSKKTGLPENPLAVASSLSCVRKRR